MQSDFTWECMTWLEANYTTNNGLPGFFMRGHYSSVNKDLGEQEYMEAILSATKSSNEMFSRWAHNISSKKFSVLSNMDVKAFWSSLLSHESRQEALDVYPSQALASSSHKRRNVDNGDQPRMRAHTDFQESDGCYVDGVTESIGSFIGSLGRNTPARCRKARYFMTLGMNGVIDLSDNKLGSQLNELGERAKNVVEKLRTGIATSQLSQEYESVLRANVMDRRENKKQVKTWLRALEKSKTKGDKHDKLRDSYIHVIKQHVYYAYLFDDDADLSEQDYVVKLWAPLLESIFRMSGLKPKWGDTISTIVMGGGLNLRMDLRLLDVLNKQMPDLATGEFAIEVFSSKYYKDKLKSVLSAKAHLNEILQCNTVDSDKVPSIIYPFIMVTGFEISLFQIHLAYPGLYVLEKVDSAWFPTTITEIYDKRIHEMLTVLDRYLNMCLTVRSFHCTRNDKHKLGRRKSMDDLINKQHPPSTATTGTVWIRSIWVPDQELE